MASILYATMPPRIFFEQDSLEARGLLAFLERESPACEVLLISDPAQGALLSAAAQAKVLVVQGGLADGRAQILLTHLSSRKPAIDYFLLLDRRRCQGGLPESSLEQIQEQLKASLSQGWLLLKFLEPVKTN